MKEKLEKLAELIKHPEAEYSKQGRQLFVDLNLGHQATLDLLYVLAPELESHDFIWINEVNTYLSRFLTFWIMAELARYPQTEGKVQRIDALGIHRNYKYKQDYPENIHQMTTIRDITIHVTTSEEDWHYSFDICKRFPLIESLELDCQSISTTKKTLIPSDLGIQFPNLRHLTIRGVQLKDLPESIFTLPLKSLHLTGIRRPIVLNATAFDKLIRIFEIGTLEELSLTGYQIETLPSEIEKLNKLRVLHLDLDPLQTLPKSLGYTSNLDILHVNVLQNFSIDPSWLRKSPIKVIQFSPRMEESVLRWLWEEESTIDEILRFIPYCQETAVIEKILEAWSKKITRPELFLKHLQRFGSFQVERALDFDYYKEFYSKWNYNYPKGLALWTMGVLFQYPEFHEQRDLLQELHIDRSLRGFLPTNFIEHCRLQTVKISVDNAQFVTKIINKLGTIPSLKNIYCTPCYQSKETILNIPKIKGRAELHFNYISGVEPPMINQGRLARYLRDRIRYQNPKNDVPFTQEWIRSFLTEIFHPEHGALSIFLRLGHTITFPGFGSFQLKEYAKRERYLYAKYVKEESYWFSEETLQTKHTLFEGGNRIRFKAFSGLKERINCTKTISDNELQSHGDKSIAYFVFERLQSAFPEQLAKGYLFLSTKTCLFLIRSIFSPKEGAIAHYLSSMPGNPPLNYWHKKVFIPDFGRFQVRQKYTAENQFPSYYVHFKSFEMLAYTIQ